MREKGLSLNLDELKELSTDVANAGKEEEKKERTPLSPIAGSPPTSPSGSKAKTHIRRHTFASTSPSPQGRGESVLSRRSDVSNIIESRESSNERERKDISVWDKVDSRRLNLLLNYFMGKKKHHFYLFIDNFYLGIIELKQHNPTGLKYDIPTAVTIYRDIIQTIVKIDSFKDYFKKTNHTDLFITIIENINLQTGLKIRDRAKTNSSTDTNPSLTIPVDSESKSNIDIENHPVHKELDEVDVISMHIPNMFTYEPDKITDDEIKNYATIISKVLQNCCKRFAYYNAYQRNIASKINGKDDFNKTFIKASPYLAEFVKAIPVIQIGVNSSTITGIAQNIFLALISSSAILLPYMAQFYIKANEEIAEKYEKLLKLANQLLERGLFNFKTDNESKKDTLNSKKVRSFEAIISLTWLHIYEQNKQYAKNNLEAVKFSLNILDAIFDRLLSASISNKDTDEFIELSSQDIGEISVAFANLYLMHFDRYKKSPPARDLRTALGYYFTLKDSKPKSREEMLKTTKTRDSIAEDEKTMESEDEKSKDIDLIGRKGRTLPRSYKSASSASPGVDRHHNRSRRISLTPNLLAEITLHNKLDRFTKILGQDNTNFVEMVADIHDNITQYYLSDKVKGGWYDGAQAQLPIMRYLAESIGKEELYKINRTSTFISSFSANYIAGLPLLHFIAVRFDNLSYAAFSILCNAISQSCYYYINLYLFNRVDDNIALFNKFKSATQELFKADLLQLDMEEKEDKEQTCKSKSAFSQLKMEEIPFMLKSQDNLQILHNIIASTFSKLLAENNVTIANISKNDAAYLTMSIFNQLAKVEKCSNYLAYLQDINLEKSAKIGEKIADVLIDKKIISTWLINKCSFIPQRFHGISIDRSKIGVDMFSTIVRQSRSELNEIGR